MNSHLEIIGKSITKLVHTWYILISEYIGPYWFDYLYTNTESDFGITNIVFDAIISIVIRGYR